MTVNTPFPSAPSSCRGSRGKYAAGRTFRTPRRTWTRRSHTPNAPGWWWPEGRRGNASLRTGWSLRPAPECSQRLSCTHTHTESDGCVSLCFGLSPVIKVISVPCCIWIPDHHVSVSPGDDAAFARVQVVDLCSVGARHRHKTILIHFPCNLKNTESPSDHTKRLYFCCYCGRPWCHSAASPERISSQYWTNSNSRSWMVLWRSAESCMATLVRAEDLFHVLVKWSFS